MATMNFSIPDEVKERFNQVFAGKNKSAVVTRLLEEAIARAELKAHSDAALARIRTRLKDRPVATDEEIRATREEGRH